MEILKNKKVVFYLKLTFSIIIFALVVFGIHGFIGDFNFSLLEDGILNLSKSKVVFILILGIISFSPMCLYDFLIKNKLNLEIKNKKLFKYSFIVNAVTIIAGLGGTTGISLRTYFFKERIKDKMALLKEASIISFLNPTGLSILALFYLIFYSERIDIFSLEGITPIIVALYIPFVIISYLIKKNRNIEKFKYLGATIFISFLDWAFSIGLLFIILKLVGSTVSFTDYFPVYVLSMVLGTISMLPGGVGSFDLTFLIGMTSVGVHKEIALLALFLFRISYFITPIIISAILFLHELWINSNKKVKGIIALSFRKSSFALLRWIILLTGAFILIANVFPDILYSFRNLEPVNSYLSLHVFKGFMIILGFIFILLSRLFKYRWKNLFYISIAILILSVISLILKTSDYVSATYLVAILIFLLCSKNEFKRESFSISVEDIVINISILFGFLILFILSVYFNMPYKEYTVPWMFNNIVSSSISLIAFGALGFFIAIILLMLMYVVGKYFNKIPTKDYDFYKDRISDFLKKYNGTAFTHLLYLNDKYLYMSDKYDGLIQYSIYSNKIFVLGNPIGNPDTIYEFLEEFLDFSYKYGYSPVFYEVSSDMMDILHDFGYSFMKLGESALVDVKNFTIAGQKMQKVRTCCNKINREGFKFEVKCPPFDDSLLDEMEKISDIWLNGRKELGFSLGFFDRNYIINGPVGLLYDKDDNLKAFVTIMPTYGEENTFCSDLMRFTKDTPRGLMDYLFVNTINWGLENGYTEFDFGVAPLSNVGRSKYSFLSEKIAHQLYASNRSKYSFKGLKKFKEKYASSWESKFLAYKRKHTLPLTTLQANLVISKSSKNTYKK